MPMPQPQPQPLSCAVAVLERNLTRLRTELAAEREENQRLRRLIHCGEDEDPSVLIDAISHTREVLDQLSESGQIRHMTFADALDEIDRRTGDLR